MFERTGHILNHVHECMHFSPCYYEDLLKVIEDVYGESKIHTFLEENIIANLRSSLIFEKRAGIDKLIEEFKSNNFHYINLKEKKINVKNMYRF